MINAFSLVQCVQKGVGSFEKVKFLLCLNSYFVYLGMFQFEENDHPPI